MTTPSLSIVVLTLDEADHVRACLIALARQQRDDLEVVVVDAASTDGTVEIVEELEEDFPIPLRLEAADRRLPVGEARNRGIQLARAPAVAFLSADVEAAAGWADRALAGLRKHDVVYGRQIHAPRERTLAAAVRGLRYHFPAGPADKPARYASHANAAMRRAIPLRFPFGHGSTAGAVDDLLLAERAREAGYDVGYDPEMVVAHRDVTRLGDELAKNRREAAGWGAHADELGLHVPVLAWGALVGLAVLLAMAAPGPVSLGGLAAVLWLPAARRVARRRSRMRARDLAAGAALSPAFDLAFLVRYLRTLAVHRWAAATGDDPAEEMQA